VSDEAQLITNIAGFHFATVEHGGSTSLRFSYSQSNQRYRRHGNPALRNLTRQARQRAAVTQKRAWSSLIGAFTELSCERIRRNTLLPARGRRWSR